MANITSYDNPQDGKNILRDAITAGKVILLKQFGYNANLGGETIIFQVGLDTLEVGIGYLGDDVSLIE